MRLVVGVVGGGGELRRALEWGWEWWQASATGPRNALEFSEKGGTSVTARFEGLKKGRRGRVFPFLSENMGFLRDVGVTQILSSASAGLGP